MKTIYKYPLSTTDEQAVNMRYDTKILKADVQNGVICLWGMVDSEEEGIVSRVFRIIGTGHPIEDHKELTYINTIQSGSFVWHVFEKN